MVCFLAFLVRRLGALLVPRSGVGFVRPGGTCSAAGSMAALDSAGCRRRALRSGVLALAVATASHQKPRRRDFMVTLRSWVQPDLFGGPDVVLTPRTGQKKTPATVTSSPGAVTSAILKGNTSDQKCSRNLVRVKAQPR